MPQELARSQIGPVDLLVIAFKPPETMVTMGNKKNQIRPEKEAEKTCHMFLCCAGKLMHFALPP